MGKERKADVVFSCSDIHFHKSSAEFGTTPENPILVRNIFMEYVYLDGLFFEDGEDVIYSRIRTCRSDTGHILDEYAIYRPDSDEIVCYLYFDGYAGTKRVNVPKGFYLKLGDKILRYKKSLFHLGQGCLSPVLLMFGATISIKMVKILF